MNLEGEILESVLITKLQEYQIPCKKQNINQSLNVSSLIMELNIAKGKRPSNQQEYQEKKKHLYELLTKADFNTVKQDELHYIDDKVTSFITFLRSYN